tara:strand:+ start:1127 stop:1771 length:645 start_codon:yes stop_codon:yes gene_type:complete
MIKMEYSYGGTKNSGNASGKIKSLLNKVKNLKKSLPKSKKSEDVASFSSIEENETPLASATKPEDYQFSSSKSKKFDSSKITSILGGNKLLVGGVLVILAVVVVIGGNMTGYATYTSSLENDLNVTQHTLNDTVEDLTFCQNDLISAASARQNAEGVLTECETNLTVWSEKYNAKTVSYDSLKNDYEALQETHEDLAAKYDNIINAINNLNLSS